MQSAVSA